MAAVAISLDDLSAYEPEGISGCIEAEKRSFPDDVVRTVRGIIEDVERRGDEALIEYTGRFDGVRLSPPEIVLSTDEILDASRDVGLDAVTALRCAVDRVRGFHAHTPVRDSFFIDGLGNRLRQRCTPIPRVGIYIPGGKASYPSTLVMSAVPALAAGVEEISVVSPPASFKTPSALCAAIGEIGSIGNVYRIGGVHGVAALALGTETVSPVDKIVGPGNIYVTCAKKELYGRVDIDMVAGPSEVLVIADGSVDPKLTAADLLAQAEHDEHARALCVTWSDRVARSIQEWVARLVKNSPRRAIVSEALRQNGRIYLVRNEECALALANAVAPEHLELHVSEPNAMVQDVRNAGAVFIGANSAEAFGDYISGPSHVLPTGGTARFFSVLGVHSFVRYSSCIEMSKRGVEELGGHARTIARVEGLDAHADSLSFRINGD